MAGTRKAAADNGRHKINKTKIARILSVIVLTVITAIFTYGPEFSPKIPGWQEIYSYFGLELEEGAAVCDLPLSVSFIDVGQGDSIYINTDNFKALIDTGESGNEEKIITLLDTYGTKTLDMLIITHPHSDHMGSAGEILSKVSVKKLVVPDMSLYTPTDDSNSNGREDGERALDELIQLAEKKGAEIVYAKAGVKLVAEREVEQGHTFTMEALAPVRKTDNLNDISLVIKLTFGETSFLFTGDAEILSEYAMLSRDFSDGTNRVSADVLKVGHHGSKTSSCEDFIAAVHPAYAVIMCGAGNDYGHPHSETLKTLGGAGVKVFRTDLLGTIVIGSDGKDIKIP